ncbi:MAG: TPM domain-containing protein [Lachnospiraceae bacterium]|nr:TPM domain-containing protein [Lachnospiraceae bacterium]
MKKKLFCLMLVLIAILIPSGVIMAKEPHDVRLVDEAGLLSGDEQEKIRGKLDSVSEKQKFEIVIVTMDSIGASYPEDFADDYYDYHNYGYNDSRDGILLLVSMEDRDWHISTTGYGVTAVTDAGIEYLSDRFLPDLSNGNYAAAFDTFIDDCDRFVTHARNDKPYDEGNMPKTYNALLIVGGSVLAGLIIAIIVVSVFMGQLKSVRARKTAAEYIVTGSMKVEDSRDIYLYSNVTKRARPKQTSSSSSGGGSRTHRSSSGRSHGGGGGKF